MKTLKESLLSDIEDTLSAGDAEVPRVLILEYLEDNYRGTLRTWFIRYYAVMLKMGGLTLYPGRSLVTNIGFDGTGDNCVRLERNPYWISHLADSVPVKKIKKLRENRLAAHEIYAFHSGRWYNRRRRTKLISTIFSYFHLPMIGQKY